MIVYFVLAILLFSSKGNSASSVCPSGEYPVHAHHRNAYTPADGTAVKSTNVKFYCKVLTKNSQYGVERFRSGVPTDWPHKTEKPSLWTEGEKANLIEALEYLPNFLLSNKILGIYRLKESKDFPNPASHADGIIVIYDTSFQSSRNLSRILGHELSHQIYLDLSEDNRIDYRKTTGWHLDLESDGKIYWTGRKDGYVENDGRTSHEEDFANNLEYYLFNSEKLKKTTPNAYEWVKKHFSDGVKPKEGNVNK
jgi:hypothetical protein